MIFSLIFYVYFTGGPRCSNLEPIFRSVKKYVTIKNFLANVSTYQHIFLWIFSDKATARNYKQFHCITGKLL